MKQPNKTLIGVFVMGAIALAVAGIIIFGSGKFFQKRQFVVMYFEGSVKGLNVGAPVMFRGVTIGSITGISIIFDKKTLSFKIPVIAELLPNKIDVGSGSISPDIPMLNPLIEKGLRAQLQLQSFVTGLLMVNLDLYPDKPARLTGLQAKHPEIPTIPSSLEQLQRKLQDLPIEDFFSNLMEAVEGIRKVVNSKEVADSLKGLSGTLGNVDGITTDMKVSLPKLIDSLKKTSDDAQVTLNHASNALSLREGVPHDLRKTLETVRNTFEQAESTLKTVQEVTGKSGDTMSDLQFLIEELTGALRTVKVLTDFIEQHPDSIIKGKSKPKGE